MYATGAHVASPPPSVQSTSLPMRVVVDFVGTFLLCYVPFAAIKRGSDLFTIAAGFGVMAFILAVAFGRWDWHGNPYATLINRALGLIDTAETFLRICFQFMAVVVACMVAWHFALIPPRELASAAPLPLPGTTMWQAFWTAVLIGVIISGAVLVGALMPNPKVAAALVGFALYICVYYGKAHEGGGANLARNLVPMFLTFQVNTVTIIGELIGCALICVAAFAMRGRVLR